MSYWSMIVHIIFDLMGNDLQSRIMTYLWFGVRMKHFLVWDFIHFEHFSSIQLHPGFSSNALLEMKCECPKSHLLVMRNSIYMLSFPNSHIVFLEKIYVVMIGLEVCFFAKCVHILVKGFQDYHSLLCLRDYQVRWHAETIKVICLFSKTWMSFDQDYHSLLCLRDYQVHLHAETIKSIGLQRQSRSSTSFRRLQCLLTNTITIFFAFETIKSIGMFSFCQGHLLLFLLLVSSFWLRRWSSISCSCNLPNKVTRDIEERSLLSEMAVTLGFHSLLKHLKNLLIKSSLGKIFPKEARYWLCVWIFSTYFGCSH